MGIKRTREQKERAQVRRETQNYAWKPAAVVSTEPKAITTSVTTSKSLLHSSILNGFRQDMQRTGLAFAFCLVTLAGVFWLLR